MAFRRKLLLVAVVGILVDVVLLVPGCSGPPPTTPNQWVYVYDTLGDVICQAGAYVPPSAVTRGQQGPYGLEVQVLTGQSVLSLDVWARLMDRRQLWSAPSTGTGDFTMAWSAYANAPCKAYQGWQTGDINLGASGPCDHQSQGTLTPTMWSGCTSTYCQQNGSFLIWWGIDCDQGSAQSNTLSVAVTS